MKRTPKLRLSWGRARRLRAWRDRGGGDFRVCAGYSDIAAIDDAAVRYAAAGPNPAAFVSSLLPPFQVRAAIARPTRRSRRNRARHLFTKRARTIQRQVNYFFLPVLLILLPAFDGGGAGLGRQRRSLTKSQWPRGGRNAGNRRRFRRKLPPRVARGFARAFNSPLFTNEESRPARRGRFAPPGRRAP